jgi:hypothetical protein
MRLRGIQTQAQANSKAGLPVTTTETGQIQQAMAEVETVCLRRPLLIGRTQQLLNPIPLAIVTTIATATTIQILQTDQAAQQAIVTMIATATTIHIHQTTVRTVIPTPMR